MVAQLCEYAKNHWMVHFIYFYWPCRTACGILVPRPGIEPVPPAVETQSLNHWTTREVPRWYTFFFLAALGLRCCMQAFSLVAVSGGYSSLRCAGFSCCGARALGTRASVVVVRGLSSCGSRALECMLSSCGAQT